MKKAVLLTLTLTLISTAAQARPINKHFNLLEIRLYQSIYQGRMTLNKQGWKVRKSTAYFEIGLLPERIELEGKINGYDAKVKLECDSYEKCNPDSKIIGIEVLVFNNRNSGFCKALGRWFTKLNGQPDVVYGGLRKNEAFSAMWISKDTHKLEMTCLDDAWFVRLSEFSPTGRRFQ